MTAPVKAPASQRIKGATPKPAAEIEVGVSASLPLTVIYKRNAWEALREDDITVNQLVAMRKTDGLARALYRLITLPIRAALKTATFVPEQFVEGGEEEAEFIQQLFFLPTNAGGMTVPFQRVIAQMLLALFDGFSAFEMVYWSPNTGPLKGKWTLKKLAHRPSETLSFLLDEHSEFAGLRQRTMYQDRHIDVEIPAAHAIYYAAQEEERPFYGRSLFESAFYHWDKKFKLYVVAHLAAQRAAVGTRVGKLPKNPSREEKLAFQKALAELGVAQYMTIPEDYEVESLKESAGFDFLAYINHHNSQMSKSVLAAFFDKEQGGGDSGKLVDFGTQSDSLFMLMLQTIMAEIEEVINQKVIPRFIDWNFNSGKYPKFQFGSLSEEQKSVLVDLFKTLSVAGQSLTIRPEFVHELEVQIAEEFGLEIDWETIEEEMALQKEQEAMMAEQQALGLPVGGAPAPAAAGGTGGAAPKGNASPLVDPSLLPPGFTLSTVEPEDAPMVRLSDAAAELLNDAYQTLRLVRGKPTSGGPKVVRTPEGARTYGVPIGTPITRDMEQKLAEHGKKGARYGAQNQIKDQAKTKTKRQQLGGGLGAQGNLGGISVDAKQGGQSVQRILTNPKAPGVQLLDFGDGTVAIRDALGNVSPRQRFGVGIFAKYGWKVTVDNTGSDPTKSKSAGKRAQKGRANR